MLKKILICLSLLLYFASGVFAAEAGDYRYKGLEIGNSYDQMVATLGRFRSEISHVEKERILTYYFYGEDRIGIDEETGTIVDIRIGDKSYEAGHGVKIGATLYKLHQAYGKGEKIKLKGKLYYVYPNETDPVQRMMLDVSDGSLQEIRITALAD